MELFCTRNGNIQIEIDENILMYDGLNRPRIDKLDAVNLKII